MRSVIGMSVLVLLAGCGGNKAANNAGAANIAAANMTAPTNSVAAQNMEAPAAVEIAARPVRFGVDGAQDLEACHTQGVLRGQGAIAVRAAPDGNARQLETGQAGLPVDICETTVPGWVGIVLRAGGNEQDCGTGANLPGPKPYDGPCRSGWVAETDIEITAG